MNIKWRLVDKKIINDNTSVITTFLYIVYVIRGTLSKVLPYRTCILLFAKNVGISDV